MSGSCLEISDDKITVIMKKVAVVATGMQLRGHQLRVHLILDSKHTPSDTQHLTLRLPFLVIGFVPTNVQ